MDNKELSFNYYVEKRANELLNEIKKNATTYGEIKRELFKCQQSLKWSNSSSYYLVVIDEANSLINKEIDAITYE